MLNEKSQGVTEVRETEAIHDVDQSPWILNVHQAVANFVFVV